MSKVQIKDIVSQLEILDEQSRQKIMREIKKLLPHTHDQTKKHRLKDLAGLGSHLWKGVNVDQYIDDLRKWD